MTILNCKWLRRVVMLAGSLLIAGMFLEVIAHLLSTPDNISLLQPVALAMVLASPVIMLLTIIFSLIPGLHLNDCAQ